VTTVNLHTGGRPREDWRLRDGEIETLRTAWYGLHFPLAPHWRRGNSSSSAKTVRPRARFGACVASAVAAEQSGADVVLFADATDWYCPGWSGTASSPTCSTAPPIPTGVTTEPDHCRRGAADVGDRVHVGPVDVVRRAPITSPRWCSRSITPTQGRCRWSSAGSDRPHASNGISRIAPRTSCGTASRSSGSSSVRPSRLVPRSRVEVRSWCLARPVSATPPRCARGRRDDETLELVAVTPTADGVIRAGPTRTSLGK